MTKAKHSGTCQCCGNFQKLPNDVLSNHGYTVQWNIFEGTCEGSKELPFEKSCDKIKEYIDSAKETLNGLLIQHKEIQESTDSTNVYHQVRSKYTMQTVWEQRELIAIEVPYNNEKYLKFEWVYSEEEIAEMKKESSIGFRHILKADGHNMSSSLEECIKYENGRYNNILAKRIFNFKNYITWQERRILEWKPSKLEENVEKHSGPNVI